MPDVDGPITYQLMADDMIAFLETVVGQPADLLGHRDGAFVAMLVGDVDQYDALPNAEPAVYPGPRISSPRRSSGWSTRRAGLPHQRSGPDGRPIRRAAARAAETGVPAAETVDD
jgi:hypothetical protein